MIEQQLGNGHWTWTYFITYMNLETWITTFRFHLLSLYRVCITALYKSLILGINLITPPLFARIKGKAILKGRSDKV